MTSRMSQLQHFGPSYVQFLQRFGGETSCCSDRRIRRVCVWLKEIVRCKCVILISDSFLEGKPLHLGSRCSLRSFRKCASCCQKSICRSIGHCFKVYHCRCYYLFYWSMCHSWCLHSGHRPTVNQVILPRFAPRPPRRCSWSWNNAFICLHSFQY